MREDQWKPNVTVAAVIRRDGRYLLVEEETAEGVRFNQPAGHLEDGESLLEAVIRETLEESRYVFRPSALVGIYQWPRPPGEGARRAQDRITYLRFAFAGEIVGEEKDRPLDVGIIAPRWFSLEEVKASAARHRSPLVLQCIEDLAAGKSYPLELIRHYPQ
jgi:8-oxo-dGTP pyrophosphatase MutT (NUDIX family)